MSYCSRCASPLPPGASACSSCGQPVAGAQLPVKKKWPAIVVVLVAVQVGCAVLLLGLALAGIVAAIVVPNLLDGLHKAKQQRAMVELRAMGAEIDGYQVEHGYAPPATDMAGLAAALGPANASAVARVDPWHHPYRYACWQESPSAKGCDHYRIACAGSDGRFEQLDLKAYPPGEFARLAYDRDIVFGDGAFIVQPRP